MRHMILLTIFGGGLLACSLRGEPSQSTLARPAQEMEEVQMTSPSKEAAQPGESREEAVLAGGCFWGMEDIIRKIPGVLDTEVGYAGGTVEGPRYEDVKTGRSGHAEAIRVVFDPGLLSYEDLLGFFFRMHDPTTPDRQGNDRGTQYRSAIFPGNDEQRRTAEAVKDRVSGSGKWDRPLVTQIEPKGPFYSAEDYHQDYLVKNPDGYTCHFLRE